MFTSHFVFLTTTNPSLKERNKASISVNITQVCWHFSVFKTNLSVFKQILELVLNKPLELFPGGLEALIQVSNQVWWMHRSIYTGDPRTCAILISAWGSNWGSLAFSRYQNTRGLSGVYATCIYCDLSVKINRHKTPHGAWRAWAHLFCICFQCVIGKNPKTPNLSPMANNAITRGGRGLGSPVYIYGGMASGLVNICLKRPSVKTKFTTFNSSWISYPVLIANISMRGLRLIFGKSSWAPPVLRPSFFFCPSSLTVFPTRHKYNIIKE